MIRRLTPNVCDSHTYVGRCCIINSYIMTVYKNEAGTLLPRAFVFNAQTAPVRTVKIGGQPYFVAKDICDILGIQSHRDALSKLDEDERGSLLVDTLGGPQQMTAVNESGLYHLIFQSRKPSARSFRKWVTSEVLPKLRRTGRYSLDDATQATLFPSAAAIRASLPGEVLDLRSRPYYRTSISGYPVRTITADDETLYSIGDVLRAARSSNTASRVAGRLNSACRDSVRRVMLYGASSVAWYMTERAFELLRSGNPSVRDLTFNA